MTRQQKINLIKVLRCSLKSENITDYCDGDGIGYSSTASYSRDVAVKHNDELRAFIAILTREVKKSKI